MKLLKKYSQYRRDCRMDIECEGCGHTETNISAYDDRNFWDNVLPNRKCPQCEESTVSLGVEPQGIPTKYREGKQV